jgi:NADH-quinone oxidoreductase subunit K
MPIQYYITLSIVLFCIGVVGVLTRRNAIIIFMCIELMLNAVNLMLVAFSKMHAAGAATAGPKADALAGVDGQLFVFFIMVVAAAEVSVGLSIIVMMYRNTHSVDVNFLNRLKN